MIKIMVLEVEGTCMGENQGGYLEKGVKGTYMG